MGLLKIAEGELLSNDIPAHEALADVEITKRFIKLAETLKKIAPRSDDFLYFTAIMLHGAEASLIDHKTGETKKDRGGKEITGGFTDDWKWQCSDINIDPYANQNGDIFPSSELKRAYKKWVGRPLCINHQSGDVEGVRGIIIDTHWDDKYKRVVGLCALDRKTYPDLAHKVKSGYANCVSMGTAVGRALCTVCQTAAITERDYCKCIREKKGQRINGVRVGEINLDLNPIELSLVVTPADQQAKVLKIIASMNNYIDQRNILSENKDRVETQKLAALDDSIKNVESQLNRLFVECSDVACRFVRADDGHIRIVKSAQSVENASWKEFLDVAKHVDGANDYEKKDLFDKLNSLRQKLNIADLRSDPSTLLELADVMGSKNKYLHESILQPVVEELKSVQIQPESMQENQFTSKDGPDKDLGISGDSEVLMPANEQQTGERQSKVVNPSETGVKPDKGGDVGAEMGSASDRFQFGNYASQEEIGVLMAKGGKKTADIDENLNLLLKQTHEIEMEMNKIKENLTINNNTNNTVAVNNTATVEDLKMNEARLKLRAAQRKALLQKQADKDEMCEKCEKKMDECKCKEASLMVEAGLKCEDCGKVVPDEAAAKVHAKKEHQKDGGVLNFKKAYYQGTEEPTPGKPKYKPDGGGEPKTRMNDKQMHQDKSMGGADGAFPGDEAEKKKLLRAELEQRALARRAYWLGTEEPTPGKPKYKVDPLRDKLRENGDKQMLQDKSMGGADGSFPGDEAEKKKLLRAELVPGILRTKFTKVRNTDGSYNKNASYFEIFVGENKLLKATAQEIYADELDKSVDGLEGKTNWDLLASPEYGKEVMAAIRSDGFEKVAYLLKGAQAMPPPAPEAPPAGGEVMPPMPEGGAGEPAQKVEVDANELMSLVGNMEDALDKMRTEVTGESEGEVKDVSVKDEDEMSAEKAGAELQASLLPLAREVYAELDQSADELALIVDYFSKAASLSADKQVELNKLAADAVADGKALLEEAETILAVAGKIPAGLKAYQDKQKGKKKDDDKKDEKGKKEDKKEKEDKKDDKKGKDKKDDKKKDKKKSKKAELAEVLLKLAHELGEEESPEEEAFEELLGVEEPEHQADDLDKEMKELGLMPKAEKNMCGMCGMAMDEGHYCTASAKDELVREALAARKARREALLKSAEEKRYDVVPDSHGLIDEAHKGAESNPATHLDVKPAGDGAIVEGLDKIHDKMMDAAEAAPTGKQGAATLEVKEAELKAELEAGLNEKKAEEDKKKYRVKLRRAYDLGLQMQEKGMLARTKEALDSQVDEIMKFDDQAFESYKRVVANTQAMNKTAAAKSTLQVGVREDNSTPGENAVEPASLSDQLTALWK